MQSEEIERAGEEKETGRLEAFSDGVFAIAITLLVLELKVPVAGELHGRLGTELRQEWPSFLAFVTSFATILIMWINHHNLLKQIKRSDHTFMLLNGLLLLGVTVIPFSTNLLAEYLKEPDARLAALVYSGSYLFIAFAFNLLWRYASHNRRRLLGRNADRTFIQTVNRQFLVGPILYLIGFVLAFISAVASFIAIIIFAVYFALPASVTSVFHRVSSDEGRG